MNTCKQLTALAAAVCASWVTGCALDSTATDIASISQPATTRIRERKAEVESPEIAKDYPVSNFSWKGSGILTGSLPSDSNSSKANVEAAGDSVTLNLVGVPVANAAKVVLGDVLKLNYSLSDKISGTVTIQTSKPIARGAVLEVFEQALRLNGAVLAQSTGGYRIMPNQDLAPGSAPLVSGQRAGGPGVSLNAITLKYIAPSEMRRILDSMSPPGIVIRADDARNILMLGGSNKDINDALGLVAFFDVDEMKGMSLAFVTVGSTDPETVVRNVEQFLGTGKNGPMAGTVELIPMKTLNGILIRTPKQEMLERAKQAIQKTDSLAEQTEEQLFVHKVRNRKASELAQLLSSVLGGKGGASSSTAGVAPRFDSGTSSSEVPVDLLGGGRAGVGVAILGSSGTAFGGRSSGGSAPDPLPLGADTSSAATAGLAGAPSSSTAAGPAGSTAASYDGRSGSAAGSASAQSGSTARIVPDDTNHTLLITATRREYGRIKGLLDRIDVLPTQVMLEAMIAEVTLTDELKFGVKWHFKNSSNEITFNDVAKTAVESSLPGFSYFAKVGAMTSVLDALSSLTKVNIVSAPSLMVLDNRRAMLQIGDQVPIVTQQAQAVVAGTIGPVVNSVTLKDTGVILSVVPHVTDRGAIMLEIEQEVSSANKTETSGIDSPTISQRRVKTTVTVQDGDTITLGGMIQERNGDTRTQVPLLGNIPIIGPVFRNKDDKIDRTELLIFIKPRIVSDRVDAAEVTAELRQRMKFQRPLTETGRDIYDRDARRILH